MPSKSLISVYVMSNVFSCDKDDSCGRLVNFVWSRNSICKLVQYCKPLMLVSPEKEANSWYNFGIGFTKVNEVNLLQWEIISHYSYVHSLKPFKFVIFVLSMLSRRNFVNSDKFAIFVTRVFARLSYYKL